MPYENGGKACKDKLSQAGIEVKELDYYLCNYKVIPFVVDSSKSYMHWSMAFKAAAKKTAYEGILWDVVKGREILQYPERFTFEKEGEDDS